MWFAGQVVIILRRGYILYCTMLKNVYVTLVDLFALLFSYYFFYYQMLPFYDEPNIILPLFIALISCTMIWSIRETTEIYFWMMMNFPLLIMCGLGPYISMDAIFDEVS